MMELTTTLPLDARLHIGARSWPFQGFAAASSAYCAAIDATGATSSGGTGPAAPACYVKDSAGRLLARVAYNGRIFACSDDDPHAHKVCLFDPR